MTSKPWVKTSLAPGSKVVTDYYDRAGLTPYLDKLGFNLVGYGCTTCIGNSGPLRPEISAAINDNGLAVTAVLSGNRNFEGRISGDVRMNYLASPPLVVAYALAGTMDVDLYTEPIGTGSDGKPVFLRDIWPSSFDVAQTIESALESAMFTAKYREVFAGDERWRGLATPGGDAYAWDESSTYVHNPPFFDGIGAAPAPVTDLSGARVLAVLGDSVTTDHISPAGSIRPDSPAGRWLIEHGVAKDDFNSYGARRGNDRVMIRGTFANVRLRNRLAPGTEGGITLHLPDGEQTTIYDAAMRYAAEQVPLVILAGREYGSGSVAELGRQRDGAARRSGGDRSELRAHPPVQFGRYGCPAVAVPGRRLRRIAGAHWSRGFLRDRPVRPALRGHRSGRRAGILRSSSHRHTQRTRLLPARRDPPVRPASTGALLIPPAPGARRRGEGG